MPTLLVIDDESNVRYSLQKGFASDSVRVLTAATAGEGIECVRVERPDAVILDVRLPDMSGLDAFDRIHDIDPHLPVIVVTAFAAMETAIDAMKRGAFEYLLKPVDFHQLREVISRAFELSRLRHVPAVFDASDEAAPADRIVGSTPAMQEVFKTIGRMAPQDISVLILGESGTGKELVARAIYHYSRRSHGPFLAINCAAIPESLLESELFGHERGAFTGADRRRIGKFEQANGGTIFLDEIGDMSSATQAKVLRLLQDARFERVGDNQTVQTDVRVIAATNQDLEAMVAGGRFRRDLFYRLNAAVIELPPLRARMDDLPLLIEYFLADLRRKLGKTVQSIAPDALEQLQRHTWPGNVRELQNALKYAVIRAAGEVLRLECLPQSCRSNATPADADAAIGSEPSPELAGLVRRLLQNGETDIYAKVLAEVDRVVLQEVLRHVNGNQGLASELLGMSRTTLRARLNSLGLTIAKQLLPESGRHG
jgi:two-component system nitrogen regulation response regulator GlnG